MDLVFGRVGYLYDDIGKITDWTFESVSASAVRTRFRLDSPGRGTRPREQVLGHGQV
jgi:hypothetical protein